MSAPHPSERVRDRPVAIWHQSYTAIDWLPRYRSQLVAHHARRGPVGSRLEVHGVPADAVPNGPGDPVTDRAVRDAAARAEQSGFDVVALGCFYDPALGEAQNDVGIPVVGVLQQAALVAATSRRPFALIALSQSEAELAAQMVSAYGCAERLVASLVLEPQMSEAAIEAASPNQGEAILGAFAATCARAADTGAEHVVPVEGVLAAFLAASRVTISGTLTVAEPFVTLWEAAAAAVRSGRRESPVATHANEAGH
ncbi:MAG: aspartate/glutamate racemase family protein [Solirubrobacteraceae bacterium]